MPESRATPEELHFDFIVVGGGVAGFCAAVSAARMGAKTAIVQDRPVFGGNSSSEIRVQPVGSSSYNSWTRETGLLDELLLEERTRNHHNIADGMAGIQYDLTLYEKARAEENLTVFLNTTVRGVQAGPLDVRETDSPRLITGLFASQLATEKEFILRATQYADCTGDATVGYLAGAQYRYGREARAEFDEPLAPEQADTSTMGATITMYARDIGSPVPFEAPEWAMRYKSLEEFGPYRHPSQYYKKDYKGYWWIEVADPPYRQIDQTVEVRDEVLRHVLGVWHYIKNAGPDADKAANYALEWIGMVPGKRESRRLVGDVLVNEHHTHDDPLWPDRVCYSGWFLDLHTVGAILNKEEPGEASHADNNYRYWAFQPPFSLPLRALYSANVENLWMAGRDISVTHVALGSTRVQMTHALQGQAMGTAAGYAVTHGATPRQTADPEDDHIARVQQRLLRDGCNCWMLKNDDPHDLARGAPVTATSSATMHLAEPDPDRDIGILIPEAMAFPVTTPRIDTVSYWLENPTTEPVEVRFELQETESIWDRAQGRTLGEDRAAVPPGHAGWIEAAFRTAATPGKIVRAIVHPADGIRWRCSRHWPTGTTHQYLHKSPGGCEPKNAHFRTLQPDQVHIPAYEHWCQVTHMPLAIRVEPAQHPFEPGNVTNGYAWPGTHPNLWVSDPAQPLPQSIDIDLGEPRTFNTVHVTFDTNLLLRYQDMPPLWKCPTCVRDWVIHVKAAEGWREVYRETGNYQRSRCVRFESVTAAALRLEVFATNHDPAHDNAPEGDAWGGGKSARVYEVRVYQE